MEQCIISNHVLRKVWIYWWREDNIWNEISYTTIDFISHVTKLVLHGYSLCAWGACGNNQLNRIWLLQKKAMRIIGHSNIRAHTNELFHAKNVLKIHDLFSYNLGTLYIYVHTFEHWIASISFIYILTKILNPMIIPRDKQTRITYKK